MFMFLNNFPYCFVLFTDFFLNDRDRGCVKFVSFTCRGYLLSIMCATKINIPNFNFHPVYSRSSMPIFAFSMKAYHCIPNFCQKFRHGFYQKIKNVTSCMIQYFQHKQRMLGDRLSRWMDLLVLQTSYNDY